MSTSPPPGPDAAERARTVLVHAPTHRLDLGAGPAVELDVAAVDADGSLVLLVDAEGPVAGRVADRPLPGRVCAALVSPVPGPDRVLEHVVVHGAVGVAVDVRAALEVVLTTHGDRPVELVLGPEASVLLRVTVEHLRLGGEPVDPAGYARAAADPLAEVSDETVGHLLREHAEDVLRLARLLGPAVVGGAVAVAPERVDRFGITMRVDRPGRTARARLDFPAALRGPAELPGALRELRGRAAQVTACPFSGEPRAS